MQLDLTKKQYRRLLDLVYIGNWILNSNRDEDRIRDYDEVESLLFSKAPEEGMDILAKTECGEVVPSDDFIAGGIHEAINDYESCIFFSLLAEDLARRDMEEENADLEDQQDLMRRFEAYMDEFELYGTDHVLVIPDEE